MVCALERQVRTFEMPGTGILDFEAHAKAIAKAGIYDFGIHHDQILVPVVLRHWGVEALEGLTPEAERRPGRAGQAHRAHRPGRPPPRVASASHRRRARPRARLRLRLTRAVRPERS